MCPPAPGAGGTCAAGVCSTTCFVGFGACDGNVTNGCETDTVARVFTARTSQRSSNATSAQGDDTTLTR